jgi:hypothetical protein
MCLSILQRTTLIAVASVGGVLVGLQPAFAYLDPGTGSILIQGLIAAIVGGLFALKTYWYRLKGFFRRDSGKEEEKQPEEENNSPRSPTD